MKCEDCKFYGIYRGRNDAGLYLCLRYPSYVRKQKTDWCGEFAIREPAPPFDAEKVANYTISIDGETVGTVDMEDGHLKLRIPVPPQPAAPFDAEKVRELINRIMTLPVEWAEATKDGIGMDALEVSRKAIFLEMKLLAALGIED